MRNCPKCGTAQSDGTGSCRLCGTVLSGQNQSTSIACHEWENRTGSLFVSLWKTVKSILSAPKQFFRRISARSNLGQAYLFYLLLLLASLPMTMLFQSAGSSANSKLILLEPFLMIPAGAAGIFIGAALLQLLFSMTGVKKAGFRETSAVLCYSNAPLILALLPIPILPVFAAALWSFALQIIGTAEVHRCSLGKMAAIQIVPIVLALTALAGCIALLAVLAAAAGVSMADAFSLQEILDLIR